MYIKNEMSCNISFIYKYKYYLQENPTEIIADLLSELVQSVVGTVEGTKDVGEKSEQ